MKGSIAVLIVWLLCFTKGLPNIRFDLEYQYCPKMYQKVFSGFVPSDLNDMMLEGTAASPGIYYKLNHYRTLYHCLLDCCSQDNCNIALMVDTDCFTIECTNYSSCEPERYIAEKNSVTKEIHMILVNPINSNDSWSSVYELPDDHRNERYIGDFDTEDLCGTSKFCEKNELCDKELGLCKCDEGYVRLSLRELCTSLTPANQSKGYSPSDIGFDGLGAGKVYLENGKKTNRKPIAVSALSKTVRLPENEVTLSAYTVPEEAPGQNFQYEWELLSPSKDQSVGASAKKTGSTFKLTNLREGVYSFKVSVTALGAYGETIVNVTVLPRKRINEPPKAIVTPSSLIVKLPNTFAVLDGSTSTDDDAVVSYKWELQQGPLGYQQHVLETPTLQLDNLKTPGNYTFKLTVKDSENVTNSALGNITVIKLPDYPPEANAGQDRVIYLPVNNVSLNGNLSTDDHGITAWQWTKSVSDENKAVDMQDTRTPLLKLSNLEEGMYTFTLKVTDTSNQTSSPSEVHVFVKPPTNHPPIANAGANVTISLPDTSVVLDGKLSTDDTSIVSWNWSQIEGPNNAKILSANSSRTKVVGLTKGIYKMQLLVMDMGMNYDTSDVFITVNQNQNAPPKADAGDDRLITMPLDAVVFNGSGSYDDLKIVRWKWTREPSSLAIGNILLDSDRSSTLIVSGVTTGRYEFRLRVTDEQGEYDEDTVSVMIKEDPYLYSMVHLTLLVQAAQFTMNQANSVTLKIELLLDSESRVNVRSWVTESTTGRAQLRFFVTDRNGVAIPAPEIVALLKRKLSKDSSLLQLSVSNVKTAICQNNCSGHGKCNEITRACSCSAFWMYNLYEVYVMDGEPNCGWSVLYVGVFIIGFAVSVTGLTWLFTSWFRNGCFIKPKSRKRYKLVSARDDEIRPRRLGMPMRLNVSDTDTESDVILDIRKTRSGNGTNKIGGTISENQAFLQAIQSEA